ncbi:Cu/Zn superoxide dismutase [Hymenopellis radicata]|nr:Cu/Zn superoxide dismutase [Hymenopellis radicata]
MCSGRTDDEDPRTAVVFVSGNSTVKGTVVFQQESPDDLIHIKAAVTGLDPNSLRGWHVHVSGNLTDGCTSAGPHFNPFNLTHGAPDDKIRHVGDLGNLKSDAHGAAMPELTDTELTLFGDLSIIGRALVIHAGTDDLGKGGNAESLANGNSGPRSACGVIGWA